MGTPRRPSRVWGSLQTSWARPQLPQGPKPRGGWGQGPGSRVGGSGGRFLVTQSLLLSLCEIHRAKNKTPRQLTRASQVSGTGRAGHLPGNLEDLAQAGSTHLTGEPCPLPPSGPWALPLATDRPCPPHLHVASVQLPTLEWPHPARVSWALLHARVAALPAAPLPRLPPRHMCAQHFRLELSTRIPAPRPPMRAQPPASPAPSQGAPAARLWHPV